MLLYTYLLFQFTEKVYFLVNELRMESNFKWQALAILNAKRIPRIFSYFWNPAASNSVLIVLFLLAAQTFADGNRPINV